jgi:hypothetical protein
LFSGSSSIPSSPGLILKSSLVKRLLPITTQHCDSEFVGLAVMLLTLIGDVLGSNVGRNTG